MLDAARAVFAERGYAGATVEQIAHRAEFGKGTLYNYFPDGKEQMLFAIFDGLYDDLCGLIADTFPSESAGAWKRNARDRFDAMLQGVLAYFESKADLFSIAAREAQRMCLSESREQMTRFWESRERVIRALAVQVERAVEAGIMRPLPPVSVAHMLLGNLSGIQMHRYIESRNADPASGLDTGEAANLLASLLFDGLFVTPAQDHVA